VSFPIYFFLTFQVGVNLQNNTSTQPVPSLGSLVGNAGLYQLSNLSITDNPNSKQFGGVTPSLARLAMEVFTGGDIVYWESPCGVNCSYSIVFDGPAYSCVERPPVNGLQNPALTYSTPSDPAFIYTTSLILTDSPGGIPYSNFTGEVSEGISINRTFITTGTSSFRSTTDCILYAAMYDVNVTYENNIPTIITTVDPYEQIYNSIIAQMDSVEMDLTRETQSHYNFANSSTNETVSFSNFYAIEQAVEALLGGTISLETGVLGAVSNSSFLLWSFVDWSDDTQQIITYPSNFSKALEDLLVNTTLSLLSWASNPPPNNTMYAWLPDVKPAIYTSVPVSALSYPARYNYSALTLWEVYGSALVIGASCLVLGFYLMRHNALCGADLSFTEILLTTRNPKLDALCASNVGGNLTTNVLSAKLRLGRVKDSGKLGFGFENDVLPLKIKGK
jgi:hypothetical protein